MGTTKWLKCESCCAFLSFYLTFCNKLQDNMLKKESFFKFSLSLAINLLILHSILKKIKGF